MPDAWLPWLTVAAVVAGVLVPLEQSRRLRIKRRQLFEALVRLDEARRYVDRDRSVEHRRAERATIQRRTARETIVEMQDLIRASLQGQALLRAEMTAARAREVLASDFGALDG